MLFSEINLKKEIQKAINDLGFEKPTPIQKETIPFLIDQEQDLIALAQTGTGKTAAFGLPIIEKIDINKNMPQAIILCPTRELCLQITKDIESYSKYLKKLKATAVYGGANIQSQIRSISSGSQIIVGTPGRVIDLIKRKKLILKHIDIVVLDEADEMLNMGFKEDLDIILAETPEEKQTLLFSATMPKEVMRISKNYMFSPKKIEVAKRNEGAKNVEHHYYLVNAKDKYKALRRICDINTNIYGIVFCRTRRETKDIANKLMQDGYNADALHGELSQAQRDHVMNRFRKKNIQILVATDVAARGLDIDNLSHVINYNLPDDNEVYIHRSGRTGRAGNKGISIIIAHSRETRKIGFIEKMLKKEITYQKVPSGEEICEIQLLNMVDKVVKTEISSQIEKYLPSVEEKFSHLNKEELIKHFISAEFNRFLLFYKNSNNINLKEQKNKIEKNISKNRNRNGHSERGFTRFFINIGRSNKLQTHNLIGMINEFTKNRNLLVGKIDIFKNFSFFEVEEAHENLILKSFLRKEWNGEKLLVEKSKAPKEQDTKLKSAKKSRKRTSRKLTQNKRNSKSTKSVKGSFKEKFKRSKRRN